MLENQRDAFRAETLDLQEFEGGGRKLLQQHIAAFAGAVIDDLGEHRREPFPDARDVGDLAGGIAQDIGDTFGVAFNRGGAVAVASNAERVFARDLHQIGRFRQYPRDFLVFQKGALHGASSNCSD